MTREEIVERLIPLIENVFNEDAIEYSDDLSAEDIEEWDSLSHIRFRQFAWDRSARRAAPNALKESI